MLIRPVASQTKRSAEAGSGERVHAAADEPFVAEEQVVDEAERGHAVGGVQRFHLGDDAFGCAGADGDIRVGADGGPAEGAVVGAAAGSDHVGLETAVGCQVGVVDEEPPVDERQPVDVRGQMVAGARPATGDGLVQDRVLPHDAGQVGAGTTVVEQFRDPSFAFAEDEGLESLEAGIGEDGLRHGLGLMATDHDHDVAVQPGGDLGADLVGRGQQVESGPARPEAVDELGGLF